MSKPESELILEFIKQMESIDIEVSSRYGDHEETKKYLEGRE
jgi:hypothetical protein